MESINWKKYNLSKLCLGTVQFGLNYGIANNQGKVSFIEMEKILKYITHKGINCLDTARSYGDSEARLGKYIKKNNQNDINIISKINSEIFDLSFSEIRKELFLSLKKLEKNSLFGLLLHDSKTISNWSHSTSLYIKKLKEEKLIENFGISIYTNDEFKFAVNNENIDIIQIPFNIFDQRAIKNNWLEMAKRNNKLIFIRSIYLQGLILMDMNNIPYNLTEILPYLKHIDLICKEYKITRNKLALSFVSQIADSSIILFGCDNINQAIENINSFENKPILTEYLMNYIQKEFSNLNENIYNPLNWNKK